jgi:hypothetical protein
MDRDSFLYALENTRTHVEPSGLIETFGSTAFDFVLVSELMDEVNRVRLRRGTLQAERPRLVTPDHYARIILDGFGDKAREFANWLEGQGDELKFLRYGFQFTKSNMSEKIVSGQLEKIIAEATDEAHSSGDHRRAVIESVDDGWEVSLLKLAVETARRSAGGNVEEWKKRGLL